MPGGEIVISQELMHIVPGLDLIRLVAAWLCIESRREVFVLPGGNVVIGLASFSSCQCENNFAALTASMP